MKFDVPAALAGERVDRVISTLADISRSSALTLISEGAVELNGSVITKPSQKVDVGSVLKFDPPEQVEAVVTPEPSVEFEVVYEDDDIVVVNKPAGLVVHPGAGNPDGTLVNGLVARYPEMTSVGESDRPGIVSRLDVGTSGLMVVARSGSAYAFLVEQFSEHFVRRTYVALVDGHIESDAGEVNAPIGRSARQRTRMAVVNDGKDALTRYRVLRRFDEPRPSSLVECELETGRTHQIRVHMSAIGHPVIGDDLYGKSSEGLGVPRPMLHATRLRLEHPKSGELMEFESPLPSDFSKHLASM